MKKVAGKTTDLFFDDIDEDDIHADWAHADYKFTNKKLQLEKWFTGNSWMDHHDRMLRATDKLRREGAWKSKDPE